MEQGQPPPAETERAEPDAQEQATPPRQGGPPEAGTTDQAQASAGRDERQAAEEQPKEAPPAPQPISWGSLSPEDRKRLLDEADAEELRSHERVAGLSGQAAERLYRRRVGSLTYDDLPENLRDSLLEQARERAREREQTEQERQLGQQGEFYSLGQKRWEALQQDQTAEQRRRAERETENRVLTGFQQSVQSWATENFPPDVLDRTASALRDNGEMDKLDFKGQYQLWLKTLYQTAQEHTAEDREKQARARWEKEDLPTYKERWLAERNGGEPSPTTDEGPAPGTRELTDEVIGAMDLEEFKAVWDLKRDRPKEGYSYRSTRGIDPRRAQRAGHAQ